MQVVDLSAPFSQTALAELVGVTQPAISAMVSDGKLQGDGTLGEVLQAYCQRPGTGGFGWVGEVRHCNDRGAAQLQLSHAVEHLGLQFVAVAHCHKAGFALWKAVAGLFAIHAVEIDGGKISRIFSNHMDHLFQEVIASARNEWIRSTEKSIFDRIDTMMQAADDDQDDDGQDVVPEQHEGGAA